MDEKQIITNIALSVPGFLLAIVIHEWAHGIMAYYFGDDTAWKQGRVTLNPAAHYDLLGTIIFPLIGIIMGFAAIGWAKPVPINPSNFRQYRLGLFWVSFAGPLSNFLIGVICAFLLAFFALKMPDFSYTPVLTKMLSYSVMINFLIGFFNLLPLPPLDGSKMLISMMNHSWARKYEALTQYTPYIFLGLMMLSFMGVQLFSKILYPAQWAVNFVITLFYILLS